MVTVVNKLFKGKMQWLLALLFLVLGNMHAQQDAQYTQYMYNTVSVNPAYAGSRGT